MKLDETEIEKLNREMDELAKQAAFPRLSPNDPSPSGYTWFKCDPTVLPKEWE